MMTVTDPFHVLVLRHGQTDSNAGGIVQGHLPVPLNALGRRQAELLAARVAAWRPRVGRVVSSDLARAAQTAEPIARALGVDLHLDAQWRERFLGEFQGQTFGERRTWTFASGEETPPGAETMRDFESRVRAALEGLTPPPDGSPVAVVTHGGPCRVVCRLLASGRLPFDGDPITEPEVVENCSILQLHRNAAGTWRVACLNDVAHLRELRTATDAG